MFQHRRRLGILMAAAVLAVSMSMSACVQADARAAPAYSASSFKASPVAASLAAPDAASFEGIGVARVTAAALSPGALMALAALFALLGAAPVIAARIPAVWRERC